MKRPEQAFQQSVAAYLDAVLKPPSFWSAIGHGPRGGGIAGTIRGKIGRGMGVKPGIPDLLIISPLRTCWIELKAKYRKPSEDQLACHIQLLEAGCCVAVCRSIEEVRDALRKWGVPTREAKTSVPVQPSQSG